MRIIYFLMLIIMLTVGNACAAEISLSNAKGLTIWVPPEDFLSTDANDINNVLAVSWNNNISLIQYPYTSYGGSSAMVLKGPVGRLIDDMVFSTDYIFIVLDNGQVYRIPNLNGLTYWENLNEGQAILVTTVVNTANTHKIIMDNDGFVYVTGGAYITKINPDTLTISTSVANPSNLYSLSLGSEGILAGTAATSTNKLFYSEYSSLTSYTAKNITVPTTSSGTHTCVGLEELANGGFLAVYQHATSLSYVLYTNQTSYITPIDTIANNVAQGDTFAMPNSIGFFASPYDDKVYTFDLVSGGINYGYSDNGLVPASITYNEAMVYPEYNIYYNASKVNIYWNMQINADFYNTYSLTHTEEPWVTPYIWRIELFDPTGVSVSQYNVPSNTWKPNSYWEGIIGLNEQTSIGSFNYPSINSNGTYLVRLYEINTATGAKALLDTSSFEVLYASSSIGSGANPTDNDAANAFTSFLGSPAFIGMILFVGIAVAVGKDRKGQIHGTGIIMGAVIGCIVLVMAGLFPVWTIYVIVLVSLVLLGKSMIGLGGG